MSVKSLSATVEKSVFLYCVTCRTSGTLPVRTSLIQEKQLCANCGVVTIHRNAESVWEAYELVRALERIAENRCGVPGHSVAVNCGAQGIAKAALAKGQRK